MDRLKLALSRRLPWLLSLLGIIALIKPVAEQHWLLSLTLHFWHFCGMAAGVFIPVALLCRKIWLAALAVVLAGVFLARPVSYCWKTDPPLPAGHATEVSASFLSFNLYYHNARQAEVLMALQKANPDFLLLLEVTPEWHAALLPLLTTHPHEVHHLLDSPFGIWFLSRHPLKEARIEMLGDVPYVLSTAQIGQAILKVVGVHPIPPGGALEHKIQREQFSTLIRAVNSIGSQPVIMAGDFNATPHSTRIEELLAQTNLRDSRRGFGWAHTWTPCQMLAVGLPLDYAFVSPNLRVLSHEIGPDLGSDHRWVRVGLGIPASL